MVFSLQSQLTRILFQKTFHLLHLLHALEKGHFLQGVTAVAGADLLQLLHLQHAGGESEQAAVRSGAFISACLRFVEQHTVVTF